MSYGRPVLYSPLPNAAPITTAITRVVMTVGLSHAYFVPALSNAKTRRIEAPSRRVTPRMSTRCTLEKANLLRKIDRNEPSWDDLEGGRNSPMTTRATHPAGVLQESPDMSRRNRDTFRSGDVREKH